MRTIKVFWAQLTCKIPKKVFVSSLLALVACVIVVDVIKPRDTQTIIDVKTAYIVCVRVFWATFARCISNERLVKTMMAGKT